MPVMRDTNRERGGERLTYTVAEVAALIGCSSDHVYDVIARGQLPIVPHMGRRKLIPRWAVEQLANGEPVSRAAS